MKDPLQLIHEKFPFIKEEDMAAVLSLCHTKELKAGEIFIHAGRVSYHAAMVMNGLLRNFHTVANGEEKTVLFVDAGQMIASYATLLQNMPAKETIVALEDSLLLVCDMKAFMQLTNFNERLLQLYIRAVEQMLIAAITRIDEFTLLSPEQRYQKLFRESPALIQRVPQKHLASYLGITPISLSRMRNRMAKR